jgi:hypothetical protein
MVYTEFRQNILDLSASDPSMAIILDVGRHTLSSTHHSGNSLWKLIIRKLHIFLANGWGQIYKSSVWTLTYRELKALEIVTSATIETYRVSHNLLN